MKLCNHFKYMKTRRESDNPCACCCCVSSAVIKKSYSVLLRWRAGKIYLYLYVHCIVNLQILFYFTNPKFFTENRKMPEHPENTFTDRNMQTPQKEDLTQPRVKPRTFLLRSESINCCPTLSPSLVTQLEV